MYIAYKNLGETPLQTLDRIRVQEGIAQTIPMTYAGRLDPMAEGVLIVLVGEECKDKDQYLGLDKTYVFEALVGFSTDTYDLLGIVQRSSLYESEDVYARLSHEVGNCIGTHIYEYPDFSSKPVAGMPLFMHARAGTITDILKPSREMKVYDMHMSNPTIHTANELLTLITEKISHVSGDFRQHDSIEKWRATLAPFATDTKFMIVRGELSCASGTYVRTIIHELGNRIGIPMCLYSLQRTKVGKYALEL